MYNNTKNNTYNMKENDYSKEIYDKYCNSEGRILQIFLKDGSMLEGIFGGYFHGDIEVGEPFIIKWQFIPESDIDKYNSVVLTESTDTLGRIIKQEEIDRVQFLKKK
jgi:hypothetical protein